MEAWNNLVLRVQAGEWDHQRFYRVVVFWQFRRELGLQAQPSPCQDSEVRWIPPAPVDSELVRRVAEGAGVGIWMAELLVRRGFSEAETVARFLASRLRGLGDPFALPGMEAAVERLLAAVDRQERVVLYGDYDVDGVAALTVLARLLRAYGALVSTFLPHRVDEGYGLSADGVARCIEKHSPQLLVAVDCGTTSVAEIAHLREGGVDVLVLDHHEPQAELPAALAIVNPKLGADLHCLCSAGIAFKVAHAMMKRRALPGFDLKEVLDLVAIATVADIVPLVDENRALVKAGLERLGNTVWPGVRALLDVAGLSPPFDPGHIGFGIGPRLNASGRLASAEASLELLMTSDAGRAKTLARMLDEQNRERRALENDVLLAAEAQVLNVCDPANVAGIVVGATGWHPGVVGIVASRILRRHHRPTIVVGFDTMGLGKGSGRSIDGFSLVDALGRCSAHLEKFGGHEMAAGLTMRIEALDEFRGAFDQAAREMLTKEQLHPRLVLDGEVRLGEIGLGLIDELAALQPHGIGNRKPVFLAKKVAHVGSPRLMKGKHYSFLLRQGRDQCRAVWWNSADIPLPPLPWDVAFSIERNDWNGSSAPQLDIRDIRTSG